GDVAERDERLADEAALLLLDLERLFDLGFGDEVHLLQDLAEALVCNHRSLLQDRDRARLEAHVVAVALEDALDVQDARLPARLLEAEREAELAPIAVERDRTDDLGHAAVAALQPLPGDDELRFAHAPAVAEAHASVSRCVVAVFERGREV